MMPWTLAEIAEVTLQGEPFDLSLRNFLDGFYLRPSGQSLEREPAHLREAIPQMGEVYDAYLAATAESLAREKRFEPPDWVYQADRTLHHPWFALPYTPPCALCCCWKVRHRSGREIYLSAKTP